ncbi:SAM-dependent methyltransferase [Peptococcaceae bacterium]|nr:SAM-dependent methyltransferase [Peptococcaceae bacterium]MCL0043660.1 SAM-dependent methyltransferase [Peptococcaceae bacterium]MCL0071614.1 SAM-dependent methyltransferase [Peptococcaceae bacterium]MCL0100796.1 SAM-dependent methyltransferase [Peptococcaceae bacterium]MCL0106450.1 SAM-dependent methyltransferase [Peptococcaceae bacterium]
MLIHSIKYIKHHGGNPKNVSLFGQEINLSTWAICKMIISTDEQKKIIQLYS